MLNNMSCDNVSIGSVVIVNYQANGKIFSEEAVLVDRYVIDKMIPKINSGCVCASYEEIELFVFETPKTKRFVLTKDEFRDYEKNIFKIYRKMNYQKLEIGKRVKLIANIHGMPNMKDVEFGVFGEIVDIYQNPRRIKMARIIVPASKRKKERKIDVPLVNCIEIGK